jgi:hypothetical protein
MRLLLRTRIERRRAYRRMARRLFIAMFYLTLAFGATLVLAFLLGRL